MGLMGQDWPLCKAKCCQFVANCCHGLPIAASGSKLLPHECTHLLFDLARLPFELAILPLNCRIWSKIGLANWQFPIPVPKRNRLVYLASHITKASIKPFINIWT